MLLLRTDPHDEDIYPSMSFPRPFEPDQTIESPAPDPLDDVFGSGPSSPMLEPHNDSAAGLARSSGPHPSDIPRLQQEHMTAGYRDGITAAKAGSVQAGFDEGFGLGATIGLRAGELLGILEGIAGAVPDAEAGIEQSPTPAALLASARDELSTKNIYSPEYWNTDGTWKYDVQVASGAEGDVTFPDVADSHPLLRKWSALVETEVERWSIDRGVLQSDETQHVEVTPNSPVKPQESGSRARPALEW